MRMELDEGVVELYCSVATDGVRRRGRLSGFSLDVQWNWMMIELDEDGIG